MHTHQALEQKDRCLAIKHHGMSTYFYFCLKLCLLPMYPYCSYLITMSVACWRRNKDYLLTYLLTRWLCSSPHDKLSFLAHRHCSVQRLLCLIVQSAVNVGEMLGHCYVFTCILYTFICSIDKCEKQLLICK